MSKRLAVLLLLSSSPLLAQTRFDGTWLMKMDTLHFSSAPEEYLVEKDMYRCVSCVPLVDVKTDGSDQNVAGHEAYYDTLSVRILDEKSLEFTFKKHGKIVARSTETVSLDGRTMLEDFTNTPGPGAVVGKAGFLRVGEGPAGAHPLSGKWQMQTIKNATEAGTLTTYRSIPGGLSILNGRQSYDVKFDGKDYPIAGDSHATVSLKLIDEFTMEEVDKAEGKILTVIRMSVSQDGKTMKVESTNKQRGATMDYTAEKVP
ncbi:MAG TPA: hypothetical protein VKQ11_11855 [Candidatus Sulfotelmatobacter sp.]|nr:hypothetical protein [Candidatus Sulfotelmatobacter sp.]